VPLRALIIAIENYPNAGVMDNNLPGTQAAALKFYQWLREKKGASPTDVIWLSDAPPPWAPNAGGWSGSGTVADIAAGIAELIRVGKDNTDDLYVYFSGHGYRFTDLGDRMGLDLLLAQDFLPGPLAGRSCLRVDEIQTELRLSMGPGNHFYFIDACRNRISSKDINPASLGLAASHSRLRQPTIYTLYSAREGAAAGIKSGFGDWLVNGLAGRGRAKTWDGRIMRVIFESVFRYVQAGLAVTGATQGIDRRIDGPGYGYILELAPPPWFQCTVTITNADAADMFTLQLRDTRGNVLDTQSFQGKAFSFLRTPDDYDLIITIPAAQVRPLDPLPADLYEDREIRFEKVPAAAPPAAPPPGSPGSANVIVKGTPDTEVLVSRDGKLLEKGVGEFRQEFAPGPYDVQIRSMSTQRPIKEFRMLLKPGETFEAELPKRVADHPAKDSIRNLVPHSAEGIYFSETLGVTPDDDLALWASIIGASQIVADPSRFPKLSVFHLQQYDDVQPDESLVYVMAGLATEKVSLTLTKLEVDQPVTHDPIRRYAEQVPEAPHLYQWGHKSVAGAHLLRVYPSQQASLALATHCLPNRATLIVLVEDSQSHQFSIRQFLLPINRLLPHMDPIVRARMQAHPLYLNPLEAVRFIATAQRDFEHFRRIAPDANAIHGQMWHDLLYAKWTEPIVSIIAAYELLRMGDLTHIPTVVVNLRNYFPGLPDTEAIALAGGLDWKMPNSAPLLLEGVLILGAQRNLPLPEDKLDYRSPWTVWRGADI